ncbi:MULTISPECIES: glycosyltransferase family 25 protein [unclassified Rhizobium]|jgi:GR25 family glycosyltransferase involved in LPS biosynthesis|uniref:glycosyltransferase family 25 protein n=1 Tax=unclassified Rhizobium TaxID=2613769 RepID=UPI00064922E5|nr:MULTISPECIES: glycosyltransferase family 25 protein [unclassified Rhizobium]MBN8949500.1 glycosyltransferase family 25 protein [Rhizobium tropici]OJY75286.1 MAG: glycosyl transferase [Rhizobium sp. 60-20]RKD70715.1 GR25 family glycosyltransferase involved in LPS biosynthesis [Rhizobium sp. WW_1]
MQAHEFGPSSAMPLERSPTGFEFDQPSASVGTVLAGVSQPVIRGFIIHLDRARDRMPQVERLAAKLSVQSEVIEAVDGRTLTAAEIESVYRPRLQKPYYPFAMSTGEIACFLSHRKAWAAIVEQGIDAGLVFEDDVEIDDAFHAAFAAAKACLKPGSFIRFPFRMGKEHGRCVLSQGETNVIQPVRIGLGMVAQLVSRDAAIRLLEATSVFDRPVDTTIQMSWFTHVSPLAVLPGGVREISPQLGGSTIKSHKTLAERLFREVLRPLYRAKIALRARRMI